MGIFEQAKLVAGVGSSQVEVDTGLVTHNNFYYCRSTDSVDIPERLVTDNNFYYCRSAKVMPQVTWLITLEKSVRI